MFNAYATHVPALSLCLGFTDGPVVECGIGEISTPLLSGALKGTGRHLYSFEDDERMVAAFKQFDTYEHVTIHHVPYWTIMNKHLQRIGRVGVLFIDCGKVGEEEEYKDRKFLVNDLRSFADVIVVHDTDSPWFVEDINWMDLVKSFNHVTVWPLTPQTLILSDVKNLKKELPLILPSW